MPPTTSSEFDRVYRAPLTPWGDMRIPAEIAALPGSATPQRVLELGCGIGRFSRYLAQQGHDVTGIDFSPVAVAKAQARVAHDERRPEFSVGDVTDLTGVEGPFSASFDVGCFHCLNASQQTRYVSELFRVLSPGATHLLWAIDASPAGVQFSPAVIERTFAAHFDLRREAPSRRRLVRSHWYWLTRRTPV